MKETQYTEFNYRFLAKITLEAITPLAIGSGEKNIITDSLVLIDVNGLPYIPGTTLAGVIRHGLGEENAKSFFGYQMLREKSDGIGSEIIFSDALFVGKEGIPIENITAIPWENDFYSQYKYLPIRQHVRINSKGTGADHGKFDEQYILKGTRFCFEMEMIARNEADIEKFNSVITQIQLDTFRIGSGTHSGFGAIEVIESKTAFLDLRKTDDLTSYLDKSSALACNDFWDKHESQNKNVERNTDWICYKLQLSPDDFFLFGSGFGDDEVDMTPVNSVCVVWDRNNHPQIKEKNILIPATSIKGALSHRVAFYYNKKKHAFIENGLGKTGSQNIAVKKLFGSEETGSMLRGNVIFSDIIETPADDSNEKIQNHVSIDRFTGGVISGALFSEKTNYSKNWHFTLQLRVQKSVANEEGIIPSLEDALKDICKGMLPLGGGVNRGNGCFSGKIIKDGELIYG